MKQRQTVKVRAEKLVAGGDALAHLDDGRVVFVSGAIAGELVEAEVTQSKESFAKAAATKVVEPSDSRVNADCPHLAQGCGGCQWMHIAAPAQHEAKIEIVRESLRRITKIAEPDVRKGGAVTAIGGRMVMRFAVDEGGRLALRAAASNRLVRIERCQVAHASINAVLPISGWDADTEVVLHVESASGDVAVASDSRVPDAARAVLRTGSAAFTTETVNGERVRIDSGSFYQGCIGSDVALVDAVARAAGDSFLAGENGQVIDAYGGVGLFAVALVPADVECTVIELAQSSADDARINLADRKARVIESAVEDWQPEPAGLVIADPSRRGLGPEAADVLAATEAERIVLVSCDAAAGARDIGLLINRGYMFVYSEVLDLFPNTPHVEVVTRLDRE